VANFSMLGLSVLPAYSIAMCLMPKVASSEWNAILGKVALRDPDINDRYAVLQKPYVSLPSPHLMKKVFADPNALRMVFVRDPLARFTSNFLDKCKPSEPAGACPLKVQGYPDERISMKTILDWYLTQNPAELPLDLNHWVMQSSFCELKTRVREYDVIGLYTKETMSVDATCVMEMGNISEYNTKGSAYDDEPFWELPSEDQQEFTGSGPTENTLATTSSAETDLLKKIFTPEAAYKLAMHLQQDYETFNLLRPDWISQATGELFDAPLLSFL